MMSIKCWIKYLFWRSIAIGTFLCLLLIGLLIILELDLPNVATLKDIHMQEPLRVFTQEGQLIAEFGEIRRIPVTLDQVPKQFVDATLATEDQRFYTHPGVDFLGLARAGVILITTGQKREGGSTITMQVARNFFLTRKKTYYRKMKEILLALKIDHEISKDKILELYFNKIFYGNRAYGIAAAAQTYYGKTPDQLTLPEMAMLAGLPKAPSALNPLAHPKAALERRNHVLKRMLDLHYISEADYEKASTAPITEKMHTLSASVSAPHVAEMVRQYMIGQYGAKATYENGYDVYTTINGNLQKAANNAVTAAVMAYDHRHGYRGAETNLGTPPDTDHLNEWTKKLNQLPTIHGLQPAAVLSINQDTANVLLKTGETVDVPLVNLNTPKNPVSVGDVIRLQSYANHVYKISQLPQAEAAFIAMDPHDGHMIALVGGFNYLQSNYNRATQATRQPGSSFKPFIYSEALDKNFTLATIINDAPIVIPHAGSGDTTWRPENSTQNFMGPIRLRIALAQSRNLATIRLLQLLGVPETIEYASRFGFDPSILPNSLSLALGTMPVTPAQMAEGYAVFANGGYLIEPYFIDHIIDHNNQIIFKAKPSISGNPIDEKEGTDGTKPFIAKRVITPQNAYLMTSAMKSVITEGTAKAALILHRPDLAGKTGTTNDQVDGWFCGFNSNIVGVSWMGFDQPRSLQEYAVRAALPIWINFMKVALQNQPIATMPQPANIVTVRIDKKSGLLASANDPNAIFEIFTKDSVPTQRDTASTTDSSNNPSNNTSPASPESSIEDLY